MPEESLVGPWEGRWVSEKSGHQGNLRAVIKPVEDNNYRARFKATYSKIFKFTHSVLLETTKTNGQYRFEGDADLGWLAGGRYQYEGNASETNFYSKYRSKHDHGYFLMKRP